MVLTCSRFTFPHFCTEISDKGFVSFMKKSMPFWLTLEQPYNLKLVKYLKLFLVQASSMIWSSRVIQFAMEITVRVREDKSNSNNLREIANGEI
jgi:hypothetical protein